MTAGFPDSALALRSTVTSQGTLELSLLDVPVPTPGPNEVLVRVEAAPINPSDLGVLIPGAEMTTATVEGAPERPVVRASLGARALAGFRHDRQTTSGGWRGRRHSRGSGPVASGAGPVGENGGNCGRRDVHAVPSVDAAACLVAVGRNEGRASRLSIPDGSRNAGNHAPRRSFGCTRPRRRIWPDARQAPHSGGCRSSTSSASLTKRNCCSLAPYTSAAQHADVHDDLVEASSDVCDACVRRHRWRNAGKSDPQRYGGSCQFDRDGVLALWFDRPQAGVYLRRTRHQSDHPHQELRHAWVLAGDPCSSRTPATRSFAEQWAAAELTTLRVPTPVRFPCRHAAA